MPTLTKTKDGTSVIKILKVDTFEDGDYTLLPVWTITSGSFSVQSSIKKNGTYALRGTNSGGSSIQTQTAGLPENGDYTYWIRTGSDTQSSVSLYGVSEFSQIAAVWINYIGNIYYYAFNGESGGITLFSPSITFISDKWYFIKIHYDSELGSANYYIYDSDGISLLGQAINGVTGTIDTITSIHLATLLGTSGYFDDVTYGGEGATKTTDGNASIYFTIKTIDGNAHISLQDSVQIRINDVSYDGYLSEYEFTENINEIPYFKLKLMGIESASEKSDTSVGKFVKVLSGGNIVFPVFKVLSNEASTDFYNDCEGIGLCESYLQDTLTETTESGDVALIDGFESGNYNGWTVWAGTPEVQSIIKKFGNYALKLHTEDASTEVQRTLTGTIPTTFECWINTETDLTTSQGIFSIRNASNQEIQQIDMSFDKFYCMNGGPSKYELTGATPVENTWYKFRIVYDGYSAYSDVFIYDSDENLLISESVENYLDYVGPVSRITLCSGSLTSGGDIVYYDNVIYGIETFNGAESDSNSQAGRPMYTNKAVDQIEIAQLESMTTVEPSSYTTDKIITIRGENDSKLSFLAGCATVANVDWFATYGDEIDEPPWNIPYFHIEERGTDNEIEINVSGDDANATTTSKKSNYDVMANYVKVFGRGDGKNQLESHAFHATSVRTFLSNELSRTEIDEMYVDDANDFPDSGSVWVGCEKIGYESKDGTRFYTLTRGAAFLGNIKKAYLHTINSPVCDAQYTTTAPQADRDGSSIYSNDKVIEKSFTDRTIIDQSALDIVAEKILMERKGVKH